MTNKEAIFQPIGDPLTLDQLREMDGRPVWIVESPDWGHWELSDDAEDYLCDRDNDLYGLTYPDPDGKAGLYKLGWLAYAYPPTHIDRDAWKECPWCKSEYTVIDDDFGQPVHTNMIKFCWNCGRPLTDEAWEDLEKRLKG